MARRSDTAGLAPRKATLALLHGVIFDGQLMPELIAAGALADLAPEDRARAQRLTLDVLRNLDRIDRLLKPRLQKIPPLAVRNALRLGVMELADGGSAHGVVNAMVELVSARKRTSAYKGLTNAILRRVAESIADDWAKQADPKLPNWLRQPMVAAWGRADVAKIESVQAQTPPLDLTPKQDTAELAQSLGGIVLPTGSVRLADAGQVTALAGYDDGTWWVQDAAAALPVRLLGDVAGLSVLDLCAAPGGKTLQLAAGGATVTAVDVSETRAVRLRENLARTQLRADVQVSDAFLVSGQWDAIVLDAPCSATGTMRRHPDLPWAKDGSEFGVLIDQQARMLDHALTLLKPGGRLVFCTCSLLPDEGEVQVEEALERHPDLRVDTPEIPGVDPAWRTSEGGIRLRPDYWSDQGGMDGFYMAVIHKG